MNIFVVAAYQEKTGWTDLLPGGWEPWVLRKGVDLPNEGREPATFLHAIGKLLRRTGWEAAGFAQGNPFDHCHDLYDRLNAYRAGFVWLGDPAYTSDRQGSPHDGELPVDAMHERWIRRQFPVMPGHVRFAAGGQFVADRATLEKHPPVFYRRMGRDVCQGRNAWCAERLWEQIFTSDRTHTVSGVAGEKKNEKPFTNKGEGGEKVCAEKGRG